MAPHSELKQAFLEAAVPPGALLHLAGAQAAFVMAAANANVLYSIEGSLSFPLDLELYFIPRARRPPSGSLRGRHRLIQHRRGASAPPFSDLELYCISRARRPPS